MVRDDSYYIVLAQGGHQLAHNNMKIAAHVWIHGHLAIKSATCHDQNP